MTTEHNEDQHAIIARAAQDIAEDEVVDMVLINGNWILKPYTDVDD